MSSLVGNPLYSSAALDAVTGDQKIQAILWVSSTGAGLDIATNDKFRLDDANGNYIVSKLAAAAGDGLEVSFSSPLRVNGITVAVMDGGVCYVYLV